jgi:hypothetical protein
MHEFQQPDVGVIEGRQELAIDLEVQIDDLVLGDLFVRSNLHTVMREPGPETVAS